MSVVIFAGPSLPASARNRLDAHYLPPCAMGDVCSVLKHYRPRAIGIIDGYFERTPAVWHKEILFALSQRVAVFGAASMGALRAAELAPFGMRGVGHVFDAYASGEIDGDDEVAVTHGPAEDGYRLTSDPLVNIRHGLSLARDRGLIAPEEEAALIAAVKPIHYPERSWSRLWTTDAAHALGRDRQQALVEFVRQHRPDIKGEDATAMLTAIVAWQRQGAPAEPCSFTFEPTIFWEHLSTYRDMHLAPGGVDVPGERLVDHVRLAEPDGPALLDDALLAILVDAEAARTLLPDEDDRAALTRFRRARGLLSAEAFRGWMARQRVDAQACLQLARAEARRRTLAQRYADAVNARLPAILQSKARLGGVIDAVAAKAVRPAFDEDRATLAAALRWHQDRVGPLGGSLNQHVAELGFGSVRQFGAELVATFLAAHPTAVGNDHAA